MTTTPSLPDTSDLPARLSFGAAPGPTLCRALLEAQKLAQAVGKDSTNSFHHYKYASAEAIMEEARAALTKAGVFIATLGWLSIPERRDELEATRLIVTYVVAHADSGESFLVEASTPVVPEKGRPIDKAEASALTANLGYFLRGMLLLPRVDQTEDMAGRDDRASGERTRSRPVSAAPRPRPAQPEKPVPSAPAAQQPTAQSAAPAPTASAPPAPFAPASSTTSEETPKSDPPVLSSENLARIRELVSAVPGTEAVLLGKTNVARLEDLPDEKAPRIIEWLKKQRVSTAPPPAPPAAPPTPVPPVSTNHLANLAAALEGARPSQLPGSNGTGGNGAAPPPPLGS